MNKKYKGQYGYIAFQKKWTILRTAVYFGISFSLFIAGYLATHSTKNLLTLVAVLGCLPASKSAVNMVMFLRYKGCSLAAKERIAPHEGKLQGLYDLVLTSYHTNFNISHLVVQGNMITAYTEDPNCDENAFSKHLTGIFNENRITGLSFKVFTDIDKYTARLDQLNELNEENKRRREYTDIILAVSL